MKAVILAGGRGTRLAPYTAVFPKPMVPIGQRPILEIIILQLRRHGVTDITLTTGYLGELIQAYFHKARQRFPDLAINYVNEDQPTGTAGSLASVPGLDQTFLVMNGDVLTTLDYRKLLAFHRQQGGVLTIAMHRRTVKIDFGVIRADQSGRVTDYIEKPSHNYDVSMGVYVYEPAVLKYIEPNCYLDFPDLVLRLVRNGEKVVSYLTEDYWKDIGRDEDYGAAQADFERLKAQFLPEDQI